MGGLWPPPPPPGYATDRMYTIECSKNNLQPQKQHMYRKVFNEQYNFSFHPSSKDTCEKCGIFKAAIISTEEEEKSAIKAKKERHLANNTNSGLRSKKQRQSLCCSFR